MAPHSSSIAPRPMWRRPGGCRGERYLGQSVRRWAIIGSRVALSWRTANSACGIPRNDSLPDSERSRRGALAARPSGGPLLFTAFDGSSAAADATQPRPIWGGVTSTVENAKEQGVPTVGPSGLLSAQAIFSRQRHPLTPQ